MRHALRLRSLAAHLPFCAGLAHNVPPYHLGSVAENRLGLQVARALVGELAWRRRSCPVSAENAPAMEQLNRNGFVVLPGFLRPSAFEAVRAEAAAAAGDLRFRPLRGAPRGRVHAAQEAIRPEDARFPTLWEALAAHPTLCELIEGAARRPVCQPSVSLDVYRVEDPEGPENDVENILHADLHLPTLKAWLYLGDIDATNGALIYVPGSHRLTRFRLAHEYAMSVREARFRHGDRTLPAHLLEQRGEHVRPAIPPALLRRMGTQEQTIRGAANTLVIANTRGFHRRGPFTGDRPREQVMLNYRALAGG